MPRKNLIYFDMPFMKSERSSFYIDYTLLFGIGFIWGFQYLLTKLAIEGTSLWMVTFSRIVIGVLILTCCLLCQRNTSPPLVAYFWKYFPNFILIGFLETTLPWNLIGWSQQHLPSSFTAILIGTVPLFATFLEVFFIHNYSITSEKIIAIVLGLLGVFILVGPKLFGPNIIDAFSLSVPGLPIAAMLLAAMSFSVSLLLIKIRLTPQLGPLEAAQGIFLGALITATPFFLLVTHESRRPVLCSSPCPLVALLLLGGLCGGIIYIFYIRLI
jgi:drug/metabolite transporter (DMT)-like permease